ncbi:MAG: hypothetical protein KBA81_04810 [Rhabdochlamydiaceae bacterium]|nr:hypothetical protein [Rhabdochlamydiaceae bacterium]
MAGRTNPSDYNPFSKMAPLDGSWIEVAQRNFTRSKPLLSRFEQAQFLVYGNQQDPFQGSPVERAQKAFRSAAPERSQLVDQFARRTIAAIADCQHEIECKVRDLTLQDRTYIS